MTEPSADFDPAAETAALLANHPDLVAEIEQGRREVEAGYYFMFVNPDGSQRDLFRDGEDPYVQEYRNHEPYGPPRPLGEQS